VYIDLNEVPFSAYGSCFAFSYSTPKDGKIPDLLFRIIHNQQETYKVQLTYEGKPVPFETKAMPGLLRLQGENGSAEICIYEPAILRIRGRNAGIRFVKNNPDSYNYAMPSMENRWEINSLLIKLMFTPLKGSLEVDAPWNGLKSTHIIADFLPEKDESTFEGMIEEFSTVWVRRDNLPSFDEAHIKAKKSYEEWLENAPSSPPKFVTAGKLASYINWSSIVNPQGNIKRPGMYMSKNWMTSIWSWDHCFNAMALVKNSPEQAWDQFMFMFDYQNDEGALPDAVNDRNCVWSFTKPPIHGWALAWMMERTDYIGDVKLKEVYEPLCKWTKWWFKYRDYNGNGIPQYNHGNDSGWDNSTVFRYGVPAETPDLTAFLILQMDALSKAANILGKEDEAFIWNKKSNELLDKMLNYFWKEDHFVAYLDSNGQLIESDSLIHYLPLLLGPRLPEDVISALVAGLKKENKFLTKYGLATEAISSPLYLSDGYWRGPIWAPSTLMMVQALDSVGEKDFAREIAYRFCNMFAESGAAECFDALTGKGLRDRAYTWTSSVFLILADEYL
jgi:putative isomerase